MKKKILLLIMCLCLTSVNVMGAGNVITVPHIDKTRQEITLQGQSSVADMQRVIITMTNSQDEIVYVDETLTDNNGRYKYTFEFNKSGDFIISVKIDSDEIATYLLEGYVDINKSVTIINEMLGYSNSQLAEKIPYYANELNADGNKFAYLLSDEAKLSVAEVLKNSGYTASDFDMNLPEDTVISSCEEFMGIFDEKLLVECIHCVDTAANYKAIVDNYIAVSNVSALADSLTDADKLKAYTYMLGDRADITKTDDINIHYNRGVMLVLKDKAIRKAEITSIIDAYKNIFEIADYNSYNALTETNKLLVNEVMMDYSQTSFTDFITEFKKQIASPGLVVTPPYNPPLGGGGGGGGGGSVPPVNLPPQAEVESSVAEKTEEVFNDLDSVEWARESIEYLKKEGIVTGKGNNLFYPADLLTREEFATIVYKAFSFEKADSECDADDVVKTAWYYPYVASCYANGIVNGIDENSFGTGMNITREDAAVMLYRCMQFKNIQPEYAADKVFGDSNTISDYASDAVNTLSSAKIINGDDKGNFNPKNYITRAEMSKMIYTLLQKTSV